MRELDAMKSGTKCRTIVDTLSDEIAAGRYRAPSSFPSVERIIRRFKVAQTTAVRVLDELKKRGLVYSVHGAGTFVKTSIGRAIGLMVPAWPRSDYFPALCREVAAVCQANGRPMLFADTEGELGEKGLCERLVALAQSLVAENVSGILYRPVDFSEDALAANESILAVFRDAGVPVVLLDCDYVLPPDESGYDLVGIDYVSCGWRQSVHVLARGARRILFVTLLPVCCTPNVQLRLIGLRHAVSGKRGARITVFDMFRLAGEEELDESLVREKPDAVICSSDKVAVAVLKALRTIGRSVPDDVLVVGVNDAALAPLVDPPLTTIRQPVATIARVAFETLERRRKDPDAPPMRVFLPAPLVERESTGARGPVSSPQG